MFSQYCYNQNGVWENVCPTILDTHFHWLYLFQCGKDVILPLYIILEFSITQLSCRC